ncbi:MAG: suppressor of fused domain protein [Myxococcota bacterium]
MANNDERSIGGSRILRHAAADPPQGYAEMDSEAHNAIHEHLCTFVGEPANVFHELVSETVHIDVHIIPPSQDDNSYTLVTTGMSDLPMTAPAGAEDFRYAELLISLPSTWTPGLLWKADFSDESIYWPIRLLKTLARFPHTYNTWLGYGHTIPNGDPPRPYADGTELCCALVMPAPTLPREFARLAVRPGKTISFYAVVPLYESEMRFKLNEGTDPLLERLFDESVTEFLDPKRPSVVRRSRFS